MPATIAIVAFDDFTDVDLFLPWDVLSRVPASQLRVRIVAPTPRIRSMHGLEIDVHGNWSEARDADGVFIVSGPGVPSFVERSDLRAVLELAPARQKLAAVDSGALVLGALGLLRGLTATTYPTPQLRAQLVEYGAQPVHERFVAHGNVATAAQCLAGLDLVRWLVTSLVSAEAAHTAISSVMPLSGASTA